MQRAEKIGLGVASAGHVLLFAALSTSWLRPDPLKLNTDPIEVSIADEIALQSAARKISQTPPPPAPGELEGTPEEAVTEPAEALAEPEPTPMPVAEPTPAPKPPKADTRQPEHAKPEKKSRGSKLKLDLSGIGASESTQASEGAQASSIGPAQKSALDAEIRRQLKPHWKAPTGADVELLRTTVNVRLAKDGSIIGSPEVVETTGITASNRGQVNLHQEQAVKAIRLASPFRLPTNLYSGWRYLSLNFDRRL